MRFVCGVTPQSVATKLAPIFNSEISGVSFLGLRFVIWTWRCRKKCGGVDWYYGDAVAMRGGRVDFLVQMENCLLCVVCVYSVQ